MGSCIHDRQGAGASRHGFAGRAWRAAANPDARLTLALVAFMLFWYGSLLDFSAAPNLRNPLELTFNSMLAHLLRGQFYVDPKIVGNEGFLRNGHVYAYWGIWCALVRLPLWIFHRMNTDITIWSCLAAVCVATTAKIRTVLLLRQHGARDPVAKLAIQLMLAYIVLGGSAIGYLKESIYQEVIFWAVAFGALFVYFALKGLIYQRFDCATLSAMALCSGLALLTRVSTGIGLILALGLLLLALAWQSGSAVAEAGNSAIRRALKPLFERRMLLPLGILGLCILITGAVNYGRWGNPLTFANFNLYIMNRFFSDRAARRATYGLFNVRRIPFGLMYYFSPVWTVQTKGGALLFGQFQTRLFEDIELPPSSFFITDLLPICFIMFLLVALWKRRTGRLRGLGPAAAISMGLFAPCLLMLTAISMTYRYRMEFYPEIDFLAFLGLYVVLTDETMRAKFARCRTWMESAMLVSVAGSLAALILYWMAPFGRAQDIVRMGISGMMHVGRVVL